MSHSASLKRMLERYPHAYTWEAAPWATFDRMWNLDCSEYHYHEGEHPAEAISTLGEHHAMPEPSIPSPPSPPIKSISLRLPPSPPPPYVSPSKIRPHDGHVCSAKDSKPTQDSLAKTCLRDGHARSNTDDAKLSKEALDYLASFRPGAGPISPRRLNQQFARVLGPQAVAPSVVQPPASSRHTPRVDAPNSSLHHTPCADSPAITWVQHPRAPRVAREESKRRSEDASTREESKHRGEDASIEVRVRGSEAVMYAVSGHNRVFRDRDRAVALLKRTPGADLVFTRDEDEVFEFLAEDIAIEKKI
ncbi:hypothetical protein DFH09DRAFT_1331067 [Mycena vulgaris]|nr:hypothetical protein DFH09DRAFT_1331067 [Mycena vulgaris]